jgi:hypothetical protein
MKITDGILLLCPLALAAMGACRSEAAPGDAGADTETDTGTDPSISDACPGDWNWTERTLDAAYLSGVWGRGAGDLYAFGGRTFAHYDGSGWSQVDCGGCAHVVAMGGPFDSALWAVARTGGLLRGDGAVFETVVEEISPGIPRDVWVGDDGVHILGYNGGDDWMPGHGFLVRFDGSDFETIIDAVIPEGLPNEPVALWGSGDTVFVVGRGGMALRVSGATVEQLATGTNEDLIDVHGVDGSDVWAAGSGGAVLHFDGSVWTAVDVSDLGERNVHAVHVAASGEVFLTASGRWWMDEPAVIDDGTWATTALYAGGADGFAELVPGFPGDPLGLWWHDGLLYMAGTHQGAHLAVQGQVGPPLYHEDFIGGIDRVAMNASGDLVAVHFHDIKQRIGGQWRWLSTSHDEDPSDVAAGTDGAFWVTAMNYDSDRPALWRVEDAELAPAPGFEQADAHLVSVAVDRETGEVWASGLSGDLGTEDFAVLPGLALVLRDGQWHDVSPPGVQGFVLVAGAAGGRAFAWCSDGLLVFDDGQWTGFPVAEGIEIGDIAVLSRDDAYFGGHQGLFHWDGEQLAAVPGAEGVRVFDLALDPGGVLWVAGERGFDSGEIVLLRLGAGGWQTMVEDGDGLFMGAVAPGPTAAVAASTSSFYEGACAAGGQ